MGRRLKRPTASRPHHAGATVRPGRGAPPASSSSPTPVDEPAGPVRLQLSDVVQFIGAVVAPATFITWLLYYFGRAQAKEEYGYFAIDHRLLGLTNGDYVLISIDAMFWPLFVGLSVGLLWFWGHRVALKALRQRRGPGFARMLPLAIAAVGLSLTLAALYSVVDMRYRPLAETSVQQYLLTPAGLALGIAILSYGLYLDRRLREIASGPVLGSRSPVPGLIALTCVGILVGLNIFWGVANYASATGRANARIIVENMDTRTGVLLYTKERLGIDVPGVTEATTGGARAMYSYRYTGLRLLIHADGRYFLLPDTWSRTNALTVVIPDNDAVRVDFVRGSSYDASTRALTSDPVSAKPVERQVRRSISVEREEMTQR